MSDPFAHVRPGQPLQIPAAGWNGAMDAARAHQARTHDAGVPVRPGASARAAEVLVRNDTAAAVARFGVVALGDPVTTLGAGPLVLEGTLPAAGDADRLAVLQAPAAAGAIVRAAVAGCTPARISGASGETVGMVTGQTHLAADGEGSIPLVWSEAGTGARLGIVLLGAPGTPHEWHWATIHAGGATPTARIKLWDGVGATHLPASWADGDLVYVRYSPIVGSDHDFPVGWWIKIEKDPSLSFWWITAVQADGWPP